MPPWIFPVVAIVCTLALVAVSVRSALVSRHRYARDSRKRPTSRGDRPPFLRWWLKRSGPRLAVSLGIYLVVISGAGYLAWRSPAEAKPSHSPSGQRSTEQDRKKLWQEYVKLCVAAESDSRNAELHLQLARAQRDLGLVRKALDSYRRVIYLTPDSMTACYELGLLAVATADTTLAARQVAELNRLWPERCEADLLQAHIEKREGHHPEALVRLRHVVQKNPARFDARILLITELLRQKNYPEAARLAEGGLAQLPVRSVGSVNAELESGEPGRADPDVATELYILSARARIGLKKFGDAEADLRHAADANRSTPLPLITLGELHVQRGEFAAALAVYEEALQRDPDNDKLMNNIACLSADHGFDLERAASLAARMYAKYPTTPAVADTLGWVLCCQGKSTDALPLLRAAAVGAPKNPAHRYHYGVALLKGGRIDEGRKELQAALKISGNFDGAEKAKRLAAGN